MKSRNSASSRKRSHEASSSATASSTQSSTAGSSSSSHHKKKHGWIKIHPKNNSLTRRISRVLSLSSSTLRAVSVLCLAIVTGMTWNYWDGTQYAADDANIASFLNLACQQPQDNGVFCHASLVPRRRTQMALRSIPRGEPILSIPRSLQIWDLDALRNEWIRQTIKGAKHRRTGNPVDSAAYLAVYLALLSQKEISNDTDDNDNSPLILHYVQDCLPTLEDLEAFHPIFWNDSELKQLIPNHSAAFGVAKAYRDMVKSEYQALTDAALESESNTKSLDDIVTEEDYYRFRVLVLSRSFGTGPLPVIDHEVIVQEGDLTIPPSEASSLSKEEVQYYKQEFGIDISRGSYGMIPILDFYDHHARPNVDYSYNPEKQAFVIRASGDHGISPGQEIVDSYGTFTDTHLFSKFGFVNGDGSGLSQGLLATHHLVMDMDLKQQFSYLPFRKNNKPLPEGLRKALDRQAKAVHQYLRYDDGYEQCVPPVDHKNTSNNDEDDTLKKAQELKKLKLQHLAKIANHARRWNLVLLPRAPESLPARSSNMPITYAPPKFAKGNTKYFHRKEYQLVSATCRLISLTNEDFDGNAVQLLQENLNNNSFLLESQVDEYSERDSPASALEFRTHFCLARLATEALLRFDSTIADMEDKVATLNRESFQSKEWNAAHLQLSEMQALEVLRGVSFSAVREYDDLRNKSPLFTIRDAPCPTTNNE